MKDFAGYNLTGASAAGLHLLEHAAHELRCYVGDPVLTIERALNHDPDMAMGHALRAYLHLLGTEPAGLPVARAAWEAAQPLPANDREQRHLCAIGHLCEGRWRNAGRVLEDLSVDYPRDALALQAGHLIDFYTGDARMLRDRIARALPAWDEGVPGFHAVLGMHAFGLEENGHYSQAEARGRRSVELEPRDAWGQHAVAHVMEMQGRRREGIAWMRAEPMAWASDSFFAVHNWWHLALFHLSLDEPDRALALYDDHIYGRASQVALDMVDASALLWRLHLCGADVGERWQVLADSWAPLARAGNYVFNDMHAAIAFVGAGRAAELERLLEAQEAAMRTAGDNAAFTREVGSAATRAMKAFGEGDYAAAVRLLRPIRSNAHRFGGSHAQRDLLDLTLIEAARRARQEKLAQALVAERVSARGDAAPLRAVAGRSDRLKAAA